MEYLFSYGTLQRSDVQIELFGREVSSSLDVVKDYAAAPIRLAEDTHQLAVGRKGGEIEGVVLSLTPEEIGICDEYEPKEYRRVKVDLVSGKTAWAYVAAEKNL